MNNGWVLWLLASFGAVHSRNLDSVPSNIVIDPAALSDVDRAIVLQTLGIHLDNFATALTDSVVVRKGQTLFDITRAIYNCDNEKFPSMCRTIADQIRIENSLGKSSMIEIGDTLALPALPVMPSRGSQGNLVQFFSRETGRFRIEALSNVVGSHEIDSFPVTQSLKSGNLWVIGSTYSSAFDLISSLGPALFKKLYGKSIYIDPEEEIVPLLGGSSRAAAGEDDDFTPVSKEVADKLRDLNPAKSGRLYLVDRVPRGQSACSHGKMVSEVAEDVLEKYGMSNWLGNVEMVNADFFANKDAALRIMREYARNTSSNMRGFMELKIKTLSEKKAPESEAQYTSVLFLNSILGVYSAKEDSYVISSSIYVNSPAIKVLPDDYRKSSDVVLISATKNDYPASIERETAAEPMLAYYNRRIDLGTILVSAVDRGKAFGMKSDSGDGVTCLAKGRGWGKGKAWCIGPDSLGTSFAAPYIGVQMLLAKAYWKKKGLSVPPVEAKKRLMLSSDIDTQYVGRFASAGPPNLNYLLLDTGSMVLSRDGTVERVHVEVARIGLKKSLIAIGRGITEFRGFSVENGMALIFLNGKPMWMRAELESLEIVIDRNGSKETINTSGDFSKKYRRLFLL